MTTQIRRPRRSKYPWEAWSDGAQHTIYQGTDYALDTYLMQISLHGRARSRGLKVSSRSFTEPGAAGTREGLRFRFYHKDPR